MTDKIEIEDWAGKEACRRCNNIDGGDNWSWPKDADYTPLRLLAEHIQKHEQPPADPLEEIAREAAMRHGCEPDGPVYRNHLATARRAYELGRSER